MILVSTVARASVVLSPRQLFLKSDGKHCFGKKSYCSVNVYEQKRPFADAEKKQNLSLSLSLSSPPKKKSCAIVRTLLTVFHKSLITHSPILDCIAMSFIVKSSLNQGNRKQSWYWHACYNCLIRISLVTNE